jgi:glycolate oxidase FAD binding subunit
MTLAHDTPVALQVWRERILHAQAQGETLAWRGLGSKDFWTQARRAQPCSVISTEGLGQDIEHEASELYVRVQAGARLSQVQAVLAAAGQCLAFEPPSFEVPGQSHGNTDASVGGMVACGLSGPARVSSGSLRDHVLGVSLINGRGEYLQFGGQVMKNVAGYDVSRVLCGSWGMLGLITQVSFKVLPQAPCEESLQVRLSAAQALALLSQWGTRAWPLHASVWMASEALDAQEGVEGVEAVEVPSAIQNWRGEPGNALGVWTLRFRGARASVKASLASLHAEFKQLGLVSVELSHHDALTLWASVRDQRMRFFKIPAPVRGSGASPPSSSPPSSPVLWRLSLPLAEQYRARALPSVATTLMEWHGALRWFWAPLSLGEQLRHEARQIGAQLSLWRTAPGLALETLEGSESFPSLLRPDLTRVSAQIQSQIQHAFDPHGVFDKGCLF